MPAAAILLGGIPNTALRRVAWRVAWEYVFVMMIVIWLGNYMLTALGLSTHALTATGGAALLFQGWPLMTRGTKAEQSNALLNSESPRNVNDLAVVPLLFPLSIGGGTIAVGISSAAHSNTLDGPDDCCYVFGFRPSSWTPFNRCNGHAGTYLRDYSGDAFATAFGFWYYRISDYGDTYVELVKRMKKGFEVRIKAQVNSFTCA